MNSVTKVLCLLVVCACSAQAVQLYRWVDSKGNVEWRDTPPPASAPAKNVEQRKVGDNVIGTSEAPYSLQQSAKNHPVTLWSSAECARICDGARAHLARRGIPYTEKSPQSDTAGFKKVSPANELPMLQVGVITLRGYLDSEWDSTFDSAGYPRTALAAKPKPAAPAPKPAAAESARPAADSAPAKAPAAAK
jgi:Domain of unknown function (DUF4124)